MSGWNEILATITDDDEGAALLARVKHLPPRSSPPVSQLELVELDASRVSPTTASPLAVAGVQLNEAFEPSSRARRAPKLRGPKGGILQGEDGIAWRKLAPRAVELLRMVRVERDPGRDGWRVYGPGHQIPDWALLKTTLQGLGGKWRAGRAKTPGFFYFEDDALDAPVGEAIQGLIERGWWIDPKANSFVPTPPPLAVELVELAEIPAYARVMEPSAGLGAIAQQIRIAHPDVTILCVELLPDHRRALERKELQLHPEGDFLKLDPGQVGLFDRVVMNPPFGVGGKQVDIDHVRHALRFVRRGGRLVAVMSNAVAFRENDKTRKFLETLYAVGPYEIRKNAPDAFAASGTGVQTITLVIDVLTPLS